MRDMHVYARVIFLSISAHTDTLFPNETKFSVDYIWDKILLLPDYIYLLS